MITDAQIDRLFRFCLDKRVYYYEIRTELVDHLASAIETRMATDPDLDFENALETVYDSFGIHGFSPIVRQKTKQMDRSAQKAYRDIRDSALTWPVLGEMTAVSLLVFCAIETGFWAILLMFSFFLAAVAKDLVERYHARKEILRTGIEFWKTRYFFDGRAAGFFILLVLFSFDSGGFVADYHVGACVFASLLWLHLKAGKHFVEKLSKSLRSDYPRVFQQAN